ncbi:LacI family DNA-binding transcriptional regulator [Trueperella sp.]|uniref:LacI family DNA-binding transcriptional regulator n=1 Tax=Trueperella sp. TaxID=2699835 RepID=UPI002610CE59|nr:LacI family DNA-binding transcriptional regulator [Trueperella sp.]
MAKRSTRRVGMRDVARHAGVSTMTVSRLLNDASQVSDRTRIKVQQAIDELGYQPDTIARALAVGHTHHIGIVIHSYSQYGPMRMLEGMYSAASKAGYTAGIAIIDAQTQAEFISKLATFPSSRVDGVAIITPLIPGQELLSNIALPEATVIIGGQYRGAPDLPETRRVFIDQEAGARLATEHLINRGHRVIAHLAGPHDWADSVARYEAWRATLNEHHLPVPGTIEGDWSASSGYTACAQLLEIDNLTAVFAANDQMALGLIRGLTERGYRVPDDISVVGFDDQPDAAHYIPPLTTISQDFTMLGKVGMNQLLSQLGVDVDSSIDCIQPKLIQRSSVRSL